MECGEKQLVKPLWVIFQVLGTLKFALFDLPALWSWIQIFYVLLNIPEESAPLYRKMCFVIPVSVSCTELVIKWVCSLALLSLGSRLRSSDVFHLQQNKFKYLCWRSEANAIPASHCMSLLKQVTVNEKLSHQPLKMGFSVILVLLKGEAVYSNWISGACRLKFCGMKLRGCNRLSLFSPLFLCCMFFFSAFPPSLISWCWNWYLKSFKWFSEESWSCDSGKFGFLNLFWTLYILETWSSLLAKLCWSKHLVLKKQTKILSRVGHLLQTLAWNVGEECRDPCHRSRGSFGCIQMFGTSMLGLQRGQIPFWNLGVRMCTAASFFSDFKTCRVWVFLPAVT